MKMNDCLKNRHTNSYSRYMSNIILPKYCCFSITMRCTFSCKNCYIWKQQTNLSKELLISKWTEVVKHLPELIDRDTDIIITGGEPLLKEGILDLVAICTSMGYRVSLQTNAFLIDEELSRKLYDAGLWRICISFHSLKPEIHDALRGRDGIHKKVLKAIDYLSEFAPGIGINIQTIIMDINLEDLIPISDWVEKDDRLDYILYLAPMLPFGAAGNGEFWYKEDNYKFMWPQNSEKTDSVLDELIKRKTYFKKIANEISQLKIFKKYFNQSLIRNHTSCNLGVRNINIDPGGNVFICFLKPAIGNIKEGSLKDIWLSEKAEEVRLDMGLCQKKCHFLINCSFNGLNFIKEESSS